MPMQNTETDENKFLRNVAEYTVKDKIRNTVIRNKPSIFILSKTVQKKRLNWIHHAERMEPEHFPEQLKDQRPRQTRSTRCLKLQCKDQPSLWMNGMNQEVQTMMVTMTDDDYTASGPVTFIL